MSATIPRSDLRVVRLPGEHGPILRCSGELTLATQESLRREIALVPPISHPALTLDLSDCTSVDADGILTLFQIYKELRRKNTRLVLVTGVGRIARLLHFTGIERVLPVFPTEAVAARALRGAGPAEPAPASWAAAREQTLARWRTIRALLEHELSAEALRPLTAMNGLCERAEALVQHRGMPGMLRCQFCPLFYELGGQGADVGCRSMLDPILEALRAGDTDLARAEVDEMIDIIEEIPLPAALESADSRFGVASDCIPGE